MISKHISLAALATAFVAGSFMIGSASIAKAESGAIPGEGGAYFNEAELQNEARMGPPAGSGLVSGFADPSTAAAYGPGARAYGFTPETMAYGYVPAAPLAYGAATVPGTLAYGAATVPGTLAYGAATIPGTLAYGAAGYPSGYAYGYGGYGPYAWAGPTDSAAALPMPGAQGAYGAAVAPRVTHHPIRRHQATRTHTSVQTK